MLVLAYVRTMVTPVHATAAVSGRAQVNHCNGRHRMLYPVGADVLGGAPIRLTTIEKEAPSVSLVRTASRRPDAGADCTAVWVEGGVRV